MMRPKLWQVLFWPPVIGSEYRKKAIWMGCLASFFYAAIWGLIGLVGLIIFIIETHKIEIILTSLHQLIYSLIAATIGWGIYKRYKLAAIAGLSLAIIGLIVNWFIQGFIDRASICFLFMTYCFIHSTRGILAHHKAKKTLN